MGKYPHKVLVLDMDNELSRDLTAKILKAGIAVVATGTSEKSLGTLKAFEHFTFYRLDLSEKPIVRSYIYGVDTIIFFDTSAKIIEKIDNLYQSIMHLKSEIPRLFFISNCQVFQCDTDRYWSTRDIPCPQSQLGERFAAAETIVHNYSSHLRNPTCIIRIPRFIDKNYVDSSFTQLINIIKNNCRIEYESSRNILIQLIHMDYLLEVIFHLFESRWDGVEIFHLVSFEQKFIHLLDVMKSILGSKSYILKDGPVQKYINELFTLSPLIHKRITKIRKIESVEFLRQPILDVQSISNMYAPKEFDLRAFLKTLPRAFNR